MTTERITLTELERRMALFDPYLPRVEIVEGLQALNAAFDEVARWRRIGLACVLVSVAAVAITIAVLMVSTSEASELLLYQKRCVTQEAAELLVKTSKSVTVTNSICLEQHQKDREYLQVMLARSADIAKAADKAGVVYAIGDATYEDLPVLPNAKATDFFLHGQEPGRRSGIVVQAVQQSKP